MTSFSLRPGQSDYVPPLALLAFGPSLSQDFQRIVAVEDMPPPPPPHTLPATQTEYNPTN
jgi:hypothetical protein